MHLNTAANMNKILDAVLGGDSGADVDLGGYEKNFYNALSNCNDDSMLTISLKMPHYVVQVMFVSMVLRLFTYICT